MSIDYTISPPNKKASEAQSINGEFLTIVREMGDGYVVRFAYTESKSLGRTEKTDFIGRELFESCVKSGYLRRIEERGE